MTETMRLVWFRGKWHAYQRIGSNSKRISLGTADRGKAELRLIELQIIIARVDIPRMIDQPLLSKRKIIADSIKMSAAKCGIYFLIKGNEVKYVGQSIDIDSRICDHRSRPFDRWHWIECPPSQLNAMERRYIDVFMPPWNLDSRTEFHRSALAMSPEMSRLRAAVDTLE